MATSDKPNYAYVRDKIEWGTDSSSMNALGQPMVKSGVDVIKADHINSIRLAIDLMYNHTHDYQDDIGSC